MPPQKQNKQTAYFSESLNTLCIYPVLGSGFYCNEICLCGRIVFASAPALSGLQETDHGGTTKKLSCLIWVPHPPWLLRTTVHSREEAWHIRKVPEHHFPFQEEGRPSHVVLSFPSSDWITGRFKPQMFTVSMMKVPLKIQEFKSFNCRGKKSTQHTCDHQHTHAGCKRTLTEAGITSGGKQHVGNRIQAFSSENQSSSRERKIYLNQCAESTALNVCPKWNI